MRTAAGILILIGGFLSIATVSGTFVEIYGFGTREANGFATLGLLLLILIVISAINAFRRDNWDWALAGAICSVIAGIAYTIISLLIPTVPFHYYAYPIAAAVGTMTPGIFFVLMGTLAIILLVKSKGDFSG